MYAFLELVVGYMQLHLVMASIPTLKLIVAMHHFAALVKGSPAANKELHLAVLEKFKDPLQSVPRELVGISPSVGNAMIEFKSVDPAPKANPSPPLTRRPPHALAPQRLDDDSIQPWRLASKERPEPT